MFLTSNNNNNIVESSTSSLYGISNSGVGTEEENLLTSDRTHFRPIKQSYADGYCFDISNNYDEINYKRSPSGYLHFDGDKYLEYTRSDATVAVDEDSSTATSFKNTNRSRRRDARKKREEFILKFRIRSSNEKCCQTDPAISGNNSQYVLKMTKGHPRYQLNNKNYLNEYDDDYEEEECSSDDIESMESNYSTTGNNKIAAKSTILSASEITSGVISTAKLSNCNQVIDQWSMIEIGKKCLDNFSSNVRNTANNSTNGSHTLWGLCAACNMIDTKTTIPANRLLKDELNIEADEIMSDLKYMQDLYIGGGNTSDWGDEDDDTDFDIETIKDCIYYQPTTNNHHKYSADNFFIAQNNFNDNNLISASSMIIEDEQQQQQQKEIFYNVTKLITDFLKPENAKNLANVLVGEAIYNVEDNVLHQQKPQYLNQFVESNCKVENEVNNNEANKYYGGLWNSDENNIWKQNDFKPIDNILMRLNNNTSYTNNNNLNIDSTKDVCNDKLNWKFSNLADIWHKNTISPHEEKPHIKTIEKFNNSIQNKVCSKTLKQYPMDNISSSGQINDMKHIDKMENDDAEILNKLDQKISENISQLINKQTHKEQPPKEQKNNESYNDIHNILQQQKLTNPRQHHSQSLDDSITMEINNNINTSNILKIQNRFDRKRRHSAASQNIIITATTATTTINDIIKNNSNNKIGYKNNNIVVGGGQINKNENNFTTTSSTIGGNSKNFFDNLIIGNNQNIGISAKDILNYGNKLNSKISTDYDDEDDAKNISPTSATIITCKYWTTTLDSDSLKATATTTPHKTATFILDNKNPNETGSVGRQWNRNFVVDSLSGDGDDDGNGIGGISINPSSIFKHVALIARPLTR